MDIGRLSGPRMKRLTCSYAANLIADSGAIFSTLIPFPRHKLLRKKLLLCLLSIAWREMFTSSHPPSACNRSNLRFFVLSSELEEELSVDRAELSRYERQRRPAHQPTNDATTCQSPSRFAWSHQVHSSPRLCRDTVNERKLVYGLWSWNVFMTGAFRLFGQEGKHDERN